MRQAADDGEAELALVGQPRHVEVRPPRQLPLGLGQLEGVHAVAGVLHHDPQPRGDRRDVDADAVAGVGGGVAEQLGQRDGDRLDDPALDVLLADVRQVGVVDPVVRADPPARSLDDLAQRAVRPLHAGPGPGQHPQPLHGVQAPGGQRVEVDQRLMERGLRREVLERLVDLHLQPGEVHLHLVGHAAHAGAGRAVEIVAGGPDGLAEQVDGALVVLGQQAVLEARVQQPRHAHAGVAAGLLVGRRLEALEQVTGLLDRGGVPLPVRLGLAARLLQRPLQDGVLGPLIAGPGRRLFHRQGFHRRFRGRFRGRFHRRGDRPVIRRGLLRDRSAGVRRASAHGERDNGAQDY